MGFLPEWFLDSVVALGIPDEETVRVWVGSGFLFGGLVTTRKDNRDYAVALVTNRHVLEGTEKLVMRQVSKADGNAMDFVIATRGKDGAPLWTQHPQMDIALIGVNCTRLEQEYGAKIRFFLEDEQVLTTDQMREKGVSEGDSVYVLGYPMELVTESRLYAIARQGCIARIRDLFDGFAKDFLVDAFAFPGNSGGPVILRPEVSAISGTKPISYPYVIGVVTRYIPYEDVAVSAQTKRPRVVFQENSGLCGVIPMDRVLETVRIWEQRTPLTEPSG